MNTEKFTSTPQKEVDSTKKRKKTKKKRERRERERSETNAIK